MAWSESQAPRLPLALSELAKLIDPALTVDSGSAAKQIRGLASLADASEGDLTFFANPKYLRAAQSTAASAMLVGADFSGIETDCTVIPVQNPSLAFAKVAEMLIPPPPTPPKGCHPSAVIAASATVDPSACIGEGVVIGEGVIIRRGTIIGATSVVGHGSCVGEDCLIHPNVVIREGSQIGNRVILQPGCVIGSDGFGYEFQGGRHVKIKQLGTVQIDDDVEVGANTTIDRARFGRTWIKEGTKIDNLVQIGHNVVIGRHCILVAGVAIAGSTTLGDYVTLAGQVGVVGHITIGDRVTAAAKSGIAKSVPPDTTLYGVPAEPIREAKRKLGHIGLLAGLFERVRALEEHVGFRPKKR